MFKEKKKNFKLNLVLSFRSLPFAPFFSHIVGLESESRFLFSRSKRKKTWKKRISSKILDLKKEKERDRQREREREIERERKRERER